MNTNLEILDLTSSSLYNYINSVNKIPMLSDEDEVMYAKKKDEGDIDSAKILVSSYLKLVVKIASTYKNYGLPMIDIISEGNIGLMRAVKTFDWTKGYKLATYSVWWIKAYIQDFILKNWSIVKIGTSSIQKKIFFNLKKIKSNILAYTDRKNLTSDEINYISKTLDVPQDDIIAMNSLLTNGDMYGNEKISNNKDESKTEIFDLIPSDEPLPDAIYFDKVEQKRKNALLNNMLNSLTEKEREIIKLRRLSKKPLTLLEVAKKFNLSGERIRQIEAKAIKKMKEFYKDSQN